MGDGDGKGWSEARKDAFRDGYRALRGYWAQFNEGLLQHAPDWQVAYLDYSSCPARTGPLSARMRELIYVAVDGSTTHLFQAGLDIHIGLALEAGCTPGELIEVLQLATMQGLDSVAVGMEILSEELDRAGIEAEGCGTGAAAALDRYRRADKRVPQWMAAMARVAPEWVAALDALHETGDRHSQLSQAERAMIKLALASSPTHLAERAIRQSVRECLAAGVGQPEIAQVFQLVAHLGLHACSEGVPAILRAAEART